VEKMIAPRIPKWEIPGAVAAKPAGRYMVFRLAERFYGLPVNAIREVLPGDKLSYRGAGMRLIKGVLPGDVPASSAGPGRERVLVLSSGEPETGIPVDSVRGVTDIPSDSLEPVSGTVPGGAPIVAVARLSGGMEHIFILDAGRMRAPVR
jgi:chemotaxis signal transduction protein